MDENKPPEPQISFTAKELEAVHTLRAAVWGAVNALPPGHPVRGALAESLLVFQLNARAELRP